MCLPMHKAFSTTDPGCHAHNQAVMDAVPASRLLVYRPGDGWEPLCAFLDCAVPDTAYPRVNTTAEFKELWRRA